MLTRATNPEDKLRKLEAILDAAQALWAIHTDHLSSMDALAQASGVAKGTLYLYFRSKEEVLLGLHERDMEQFFGRVIARAEQPEAMRLSDLADIVIESIRLSPTFLPLSSMCMGLMERHIAPEIGMAFKERIYEHLSNVVSALQNHFPQLSCLNLMQAYALMIGLWQLLQQNQLNQANPPSSNPLCGQELTEENFLPILHDSLMMLYRSLAPEENAA